MRWSDRNEDNLEALLRGEGRPKLGAALAEMREKAPEAPSDVRERVRGLAAEEAESEPRRRLSLGGYRPSFARAGALAAAVLLLAVAIPVGIMSGDGDSSGAAGGADPSEAVAEPTRPTGEPAIPEALDQRAPPPAPPPPAMRFSPGGGGGGYVTELPNLSAADSGSARLRSTERAKAAPLPSATRAQNYSANIKLHVADHDQLSDAVQSAIRTTRQLGGYVTYVDYGTSGEKDGDATLAVRVPVGRVLRQSRFAKLDLAFTTEKREEPAPPPSDLEKTLDDAVGILAVELGVLLFILIAGAPFIALALLAWFGARAARRAAGQRVLERA